MNSMVIHGSIDKLQIGHYRKFSGKLSYLPVSSQVGATPHRNLAKADLYVICILDLT